MKSQRKRVADLFCGAGGTSTGARRALAALGYEMELVAVNHWPVAIETHQRNHPDARHYCVDLDAARPVDLVPEGYLDLLLASPECTHHSRARGGRPINDQSRMSAWHVLRWASDLYISRILIENVREFREWGPLDRQGRPLKSGVGRTYQSFLQALRDMGYRVEERVLCAADYGDATTRERLFVQARRDRRRIVWPVPTHSRTPSVDMFGHETLPWRSAREVIDWSIPGKSIFDRKKALRPKTLARIAAGFRRQGAAGEPFLVMLYGTSTTASIDLPLPTVTAGAGHIGLADMTVEPFMLGQQSCAAPRSVREPIPTICTTGGISLVTPFLTAYYGQGSGRTSRSIDAPLDTITTHDRFALVQPFLLHVNHGGDGQYAGRRSQSTEAPLPTVTTTRGLGVVEPFIVPQFGERLGQTPRVHSIDNPLPTATSHGAGALVEPITMPPSAEGGGRLVRINGQLYRLDVRFRMLHNHELARGMGFSDEETTYEFVGNKGQVTCQIGNAVPVRTAAALIGAIMGDGK